MGSKCIILSYTKLFIPNLEINIDFRPFDYKLNIIEKEDHTKEYEIILNNNQKNIFSFKNTDVGMKY